MNHSSDRAISRRIDRLLAPLQKPLRVRERAVVFGVTGRRKKENFRLDFLRLQFVALDLGRFAPKCGRLDLDYDRARPAI